MFTVVVNRLPNPTAELVEKRFMGIIPFLASATCEALIEFCVFGRTPKFGTARVASRERRRCDIARFGFRGEFVGITALIVIWVRYRSRGDAFGEGGRDCSYMAIINPKSADNNSRSSVRP